MTQRAEPSDHQFRIGHPLATALIERAKGRCLPTCEVTLDYSGTSSIRGRVSLVEQLQGQSGWLRASLLSITALDTEDHSVLFQAPPTKAGPWIKIPARSSWEYPVAQGPSDRFEEVGGRLDAEFKTAQDARLTEAAARNLSYFEQESDKLDSSGR